MYWDTITNVKLNVVEIAYLPKEVRERFTSDFRIVADYFCSKREGCEEEFFHNTRAFKHVEEMLEFFRVFSGDQRYLEVKDTIMKKAEKGELISISSFLDETARKSEKMGMTFKEFLDKVDEFSFGTRMGKS